MKIYKACLPLFLVLLLVTGCSEKTESPNIVYILADDLGYGDLSCYNPESKIHTPNMDALAEQGIRFTDAHSPSGVCSPTRYGIMTGRYAWRSRLKSGVLWGYSNPLIPPDRMTVASLLKKSGYQTAVIGKWHLGVSWYYKPGMEVKDKLSDWVKQGEAVDFSKPFTGGPNELGFDYYFGSVASWDMPPFVWLENNRTTALPTARGEGFGRVGHTAPGLVPEDALPTLTAKAIETIDRFAVDGAPFFLYFPLTAPHTPVAPNEEFKGRSKAGDYGDFVVETDWVVGQVMNALERNGIAHNTLLILTSDNGPEVQMIERKIEYGHYSAYHFRGCKRDNWDGGNRIPFIARWPDKIKPHGTSGEIICLTDLMATCAAITGQELPDNAGEDSYNILPALMGEPYEKPIREATVHHSSQGYFAIRQGNWKLLLHQGSGGNVYELNDLSPIQLYAIDSNPSESENLYRDHPGLVNELTALMEQYIESGRSTPGDPQPIVRPEEWPQVEQIKQIIPEP